MGILESMMTSSQITREAAAQLDKNDPLQQIRDLFHIPQGVIYLDGNSLGAAPKAAFRELRTALEKEWAEDLIVSWNKAGWFQLTDTLGDSLAGLVGAEAGEVVVTDSTSVNIYKALHAALSLQPERKVIVTEGGSFPTDLYVVEGVLATRQELSLRLEGVDGDALEELIDYDVAVVLVNQVDYRSGRLRDMRKLTQQAHAAGAVVVWDLCHSAGVMPIDLNACDADLAVGCTYKYLNGGPGAPAFLFAARRHHAALSQPLQGWWGHARPFGFEQAYRGDAGIRQFLCGTQPILSMRALKAGLDMFGEIDLHQVRRKSVALTTLFMELVEARCKPFGVSIFGPRDAHLRGSHVAITHSDGYAIVQALIERRVIADFRMPDLMRFGFAPLYVSFVDVWDAVDQLYDVLQTDEWRAPRFADRDIVT